MRLLYLGQKPREDTGSPIIIYRHLRVLKSEGHQLSFCLQWGESIDESDLFSDCPHYQLPHRMKWWPPYYPKYDWSRILSTQLWANWLHKNIPECELPDSILCYMAWHSDLFAEIAGRLAKILKIPSLCLVHDDAAAFAKDSAKVTILRKRQKRILNLQGSNAYVTSELQRAIYPKDDKSVQLWPIPDGNIMCKSLHPRRQGTLRLIYAGYCWKGQAELIANLLAHRVGENIRIEVVGNAEPDALSILESHLIRKLPSFSSNKEALKYLSENADILLVSYASSSTKMPWIKTSFPSKLIEYSHLGLPILVIAPDDSVVYNWCKHRQIDSAFTPSQDQEIQDFIRRIRCEKDFSASVDQWRRIAAEEWSPDAIQSKFVKLLRGNIISE